MPNLKTTQTKSATIVSVTVNAVGVDPIGFLKYTQSEKSGLWTKGDGWIAHSGCLQTLSYESSDSSGDRFSEIRSQAQNLLDSSDSSSRPIRFYGGFSFGPDHVPEGVWKGFPAGLFHLPEFELEGGSRQSARLKGHAIVRHDSIDLEQVREELFEKTERVCGLLRKKCKQNEVAKNGGDLHNKEDFDRTIWESMIENALENIDRGLLSKVVLARTQDLRFNEFIDPVDIVNKLWKANPGSHVFLIRTSRDSCFLGAAPEIVTDVSKGQFQATAVAGTAGRGHDKKEQQTLAESLLGSTKDGIEHCITRDDILTRLGTLVDDVDAQVSPHVLTLGEMQHLETEIKAKLREGIDAIQVLQTLHPTPAVCGLPRQKALDFIEREEPFERGWYAGPVGWFDTDGDAMFVPALRCAVGTGKDWRLFAGAGIVAGSDATSEWEETGVKFTPVTKALSENNTGAFF